QATSIVGDEPNSPVAADAYLLIGRIHALNDRPDDAITAYGEVLKRQPQPLAAELALAALHLSVGTLDKAMTYVQQALAIQPQSVEGRELMVRILLARKDLPKAKEALVSLEKDYPNSAGVLNLRANLQEAEGHVEAARESYSRVSAVAPDNVP